MRRSALKMPASPNRSQKRSSAPTHLVGAEVQEEAADFVEDKGEISLGGTLRGGKGEGGLMVVRAGGWD